MTVATIKLLNPELMGEFYFREDKVAIARRFLQDGKYTCAGSIGFQNLNGVEVANEMFDLTNNPSRQDEREKLYGRGRSLSVGDIVNVDGVDWLCDRIGWTMI